MNFRQAAALTLTGWYLMHAAHGSVKTTTEADGVVTLGLGSTSSGSWLEYCSRFR